MPLTKFILNGHTEVEETELEGRGTLYRPKIPPSAPNKADPRLPSGKIAPLRHLEYRRLLWICWIYFAEFLHLSISPSKTECRRHGGCPGQPQTARGTMLSSRLKP